MRHRESSNIAALFSCLLVFTVYAGLAILVIPSWA